jgi:3-dehydroquinate synthase
LNKIKVELKDNSYNILIGKSNYLKIVDKIAKLNLYRNICFIIDDNVRSYWEDYIARPFNNYEKKIEFYSLKPGENSKSYLELNRIYSFLLEKNFGRDTLIIAVGGGVAGDLSGYAASTFMRGVQLIHIPTTLLAAVDSAIGGKTGINFNGKKNIIGTFYQPKLVLIDINFLSTLPQDEITSGIGEIIKYSFLSSNDFFEYARKNLEKIYSNDEKVIRQVILRSAAIKSAVVKQDEKESGLRKILNLGHTFAHAIESDLNFGIKHGEAVTAGIISALYLSNKIGILPKNRLKEYLSLPFIVKLPQQISSLNENNMVNIMHLDKKNRNGKINFVLLSRIGNILVDVQTPEDDVFYALEKMKNIKGSL